MSFTTFEQADREAKKREAKRNPFASEMSMRDYFAAKAMQADVLASGWSGDIEHTVTLAYKVADSMLKARQA